MESLEAYRGESSYDRFKEHIDRNFETGREAQGKPEKFASFHCLTHYWTAAHVQEIVFDTGELDYHIDDILKRYLRIFSILAGGNLVLKSYDTAYESSYQNEIKAYNAFANAKPCENILKYIGSYYVQPLAPGSGLQYTIMLEHAERGSLLQLYGENDPPFAPAETKAFWSSLFQVAKGLMAAHNRLPKMTGASCVHQDVKPSNIFVFGREDDSTAEFDLTFKIVEVHGLTVRLNSTGTMKLTSSWVIFKTCGLSDVFSLKLPYGFALDGAAALNSRTDAGKRTMRLHRSSVILVAATVSIMAPQDCK
ncbi:hypothetical protein SLS64_000173 [Diaporthe eres]|uniref:Protein kinase domain-containing protein n=1 Tax=Diaporthe eres TaxID=83184 RepID=A0ABR1NPT3_DIAER